MAKDPIGQAIANLLLLKRLENGIAADVDALIRALFDDIAGQIARIDPAAPRRQDHRLARLRNLIGKTGHLFRDTYDDVLKLVRQRIAEIGARQAGFAQGLLEASLGPAVGIDVKSANVGINMLKSIVDTNPIQGELLKDWFRGQAVGVATRVRRQIQIGMANGDTIDELVERVRGRDEGRGRLVGGVMQTSRRQAEGIVRTAVNDVATTAHLRTFRENSDITKTYEYVATLDSRTTIVCASLDGQRFAYDDPQAKRSPQHIGCRSTMVPDIDWPGLGIEPPPQGMRASAGGPVPSSRTYEQWLRDRPASVQDEILGPTRARLFRDGTTLRDMVRDDGSIIRIEDLQPLGL